MMRAELRSSAAAFVMHAARGAVLVSGSLVVACYPNSHLSDHGVVAVTLLLALSLLPAYPRHRMTDLMAAIAIWLTAVETVLAWNSGKFDVHRWLLALGTLGLILLLRRIQDFRAVVRQYPGHPLAQSERRGRASPPSGNAHTQPGSVEIEGFWRVI
jgi:hypothetical protein